MKTHRMSWKPMAVVLVLAAVVMLTACPSEAQVKVRLFHWYWGLKPWVTALEEFQQKFNTANPGIEVVRDESTYADKETVFVTQSRAKAAPDIAFFLSRPIRAFADFGYLMDLTPFVEKEGGAKFLAQWDKKDLELCEYKGKLYCLPSDSTPLALVYNKVHFKEAGLDPEKPPKTRTQLLEYAKKLTRAGRFGLGLLGAREEGIFMRLNPFIWGSGGDYLTPDEKRSALDTPEALEGFKDYIELYTKHKVVPPGVTEQGAQLVRTQLAHEKVSMIIANASERNMIQAINPNLNMKEILAVAPIPVHKKRVASASIDIAVISAFTKNPESAWKVYKNFHERPTQWRNFQVAGVLPTRLDLRNDPQIKNDKWWGVYVGEVGYVKLEPFVPQWPQIADAMITAAQEAFSGVKSPEEALKGAHAATSRAMGQ